MKSKSNICVPSCNIITANSLIVSGNFSAGVLMERTLRALNMQNIQHAPTFPDAMNVLMHDNIDLIIANDEKPHNDMMKFINSVRFCQTNDPSARTKLKQHSIIPFIITSQTVTPDLVENAVDVGSCSVVSLPIKPFDLLNKIKRMLYVHCKENCFRMTVVNP